MLVLTRKSGEAIRIGGRIQVMVLSSARGHVRLGIVAPPGVTVRREELHERIAEANRRAAMDGVERPGDGAADESSGAVGPSTREEAS